MQKFCLEIKGANGYAEFTFDNNDRLTEVTFRFEQAEEHQVRWFWGWVPCYLNEFIEKGKNPKLVVTPVIDHISFDDFWNAYAYKVGKRLRAQRLWNAMLSHEQSRCMATIKAYKYWLAQRSQDMMYPETFLAQRCWENEYKV